LGCQKRSNFRGISSSRILGEENQLIGLLKQFVGAIDTRQKVMGGGGGLGGGVGGWGFVVGGCYGPFGRSIKGGELSGGTQN